MQPKRSIAAIAVATVLLSAMSTPPIVPSERPTPVSVAPGDACALLTQAQVSTALGVQVAPGQRLVPKSPLSCGWSQPGGPKLMAKKLVLQLMTQRQFDLGKTPYQGITKTPVSGIGDDAYYVTASGLGTALSVKKGAFYVQVKVGGADFSLDTIKATEKTLALEVLAKA